MPAKIAASIITFLVNIALGAAIFFIMLIAMNGFSESDAEWGLAVYIVLALGVSLLMGTLAYLATSYLMRKQMTGAVSAMIAVPLFSVIGGILEVICCFIGVAVADHARVNY